MVHNSNLVENSTQPPVESMAVRFERFELDVFHRDNLLVVQATIDAE
jgi:hypothetical protein